jgi:hypothetical protein
MGPSIRRWLRSWTWFKHWHVGESTGLFLYVGRIDRPDAYFCIPLPTRPDPGRSGDLR